MVEKNLITSDDLGYLPFSRITLVGKRKDTEGLNSWNNELHCGLFYLPHSDVYFSVQFTFGQR